MKFSQRSGFSLYLTFLITTVLFILVSATYEIAKFSMDLGRSTALEVTSFHAADGGLERGLAHLSRNFAPFKLSYISKLTKYRKVEILVKGIRSGKKMNLESKAIVYDGNKETTSRTLYRKNIVKPFLGKDSGQFGEAP